MAKSRLVQGQERKARGREEERARKVGKEGKGREWDDRVRKGRT